MRNVGLVFVLLRQFQLGTGMLQCLRLVKQPLLELRQLLTQLHYLPSHREKGYTQLRWHTFNLFNYDYPVSMQNIVLKTATFANFLQHLLEH